MTSNIGSQWIQELSGKDPRELKSRINDALKIQFRPEFLNRIDEVIIFNSLSIEEIAKIVDIQVEYLRDRLLDRKITFSLTEAAKELIGLEGFDPVYGARPLKRVIQRKIQDPLALKILNGEVKEGDHLIIDAVNNQITINKQEYT